MRDFSGDFEWDDAPFTLSYEKVLLDGNRVKEKIVLEPDRIKMESQGVKFMVTRPGATLVFIPWARVLDITQVRGNWS